MYHSVLLAAISAAARLEAVAFEMRSQLAKQWARGRSADVSCHAASRAPPAVVTIVGAGAAGLTAAFFAADEGAQVTVLERTREAGKKILMSGGTRCNVLPMQADLTTDFFSESPPSSVRAMFASWPLQHIRAWLEDPTWGIGLDLSEELETAKLFPTSNSSKEVRDKLVRACLARGVEIKYNASLEGLRPLDSSALDDTQPATTGKPTEDGTESQPSEVPAVQGEQGPPGSGQQGTTKQGQGKTGQPRTRRRNPGWVCKLADGSEHKTDRLVIATGGLSFPAVGTDGTGHRILSALGHRMHSVYPALTPLTGPHPSGHQLAGLSLYSVDTAARLPGVKKPRKAARHGLLFTHKGYSGPAILDLSAYAVMAMTRGGPRPSLMVNWTGEAPEVWDTRLQAGGTALVANVLQRAGVRERLADALCADLGLERRKLSELKKAERQELVNRLTAYELPYTGHEGYKKAEVTGGGVPLTDIDLSTMESKVLPGVHLAGEVLDIYGRIGGFNFYAAWVSGRQAGVGAAKLGTADSLAAES